MKLLEQLKDPALFTNTEQAVVEFIIKNPRAVTEMTLPQVSSLTFSSQATIVRLCRKLGCRGYSDFKLKLAAEWSQYIQGNFEVHVDTPFEEGSSDREIVDSFYNMTRRTLEHVYGGIDINLLQRAARMIVRSESVALYGRGESLLIMENFRHKLMRIGIRAEAEVLSGFEFYRARKKRKKEVAVVVSHYPGLRKFQKPSFEKGQSGDFGGK